MELIDLTKSIGWNLKRAFNQLPDKIAIESIDYSVTYAQLSLAVNAIALALPKKNARVERVAIILDDKVSAIKAMLGVIFSGHAFILLDVDDPQERLELILKDSKPAAIISNKIYLERISGSLSSDTCLIDVSKINQDYFEGNLEEPNAKDLAYIFYTSGSTGSPKGVCQTHENLLFFIKCYAEKVKVSKSDRLSMLYSLSFSAANMDIFSALLSSATLCIYDTKTLGVENLAFWLESKGITILHAVPTIFRKMLESVSISNYFTKIRSVDLGGESVTTNDISQFEKFFSGTAKLINHLAATEISVIAQFEVPQGFEDGGTTVPVGKPHEGVEIWLQSDDGSSVANGESGKIIISSPYLSPGYWQKQDLNEKTFFRHPEREGWFIYRTEDRGVFNNQGDLIFLGREGTRLKIRGQSVDINEVEGAFFKCQHLKQVAVALSQTEMGGEALAAHLVVKTGLALDALFFRRELMKFLPHYMIPTKFFFYDELPTLSSGKIDRNRLKSIATNVNEGQLNHTYESSMLEDKVLNIFKSILKVSHIKPTDDFFLKGGDSLMVVQLQTELSKIASTPFTIKDILNDSTVEGLAKTLKLSETRLADSGEYSNIIIKLTDGKKGQAPFFIIHGRYGFVNVSPKFLEIIGGNQDVYAIQAKGIDGIEKPYATLKKMAAYYAAGIRSIQPVGPYFIGGLCVGSYIALLIADILLAAGERVLPLLLLDPLAPPFTPFKKEQFDLLSPSNKKIFINRVASSASLVLNKKINEGKIKIAQDDEKKKLGAIRVGVAIQMALSGFHPKPFYGDVYHIATASRLSPEQWGNEAFRKSIFRGKSKLMPISGKHTEIFDVSNQEFVSALSGAVMSIQELAR